MPTKIQWTDATWNPVTGCSKISAGCANCYAEPLAKRLQGMGQAKYTDVFAVRWHPKELLRTWGKKPKRIFVCSMGDLFHDDVPDEFIAEILYKIDQNPQHTFQVLTKRPDRAKKIEIDYGFPSNMWLGVTVENADNLHRLETLRWTPCALRFVSIEPLLGPLPKMEWLPDWVIVGGESGPGARPMQPDWARGIRDQCVERGVPFFLKQLGEFGESGNQNPLRQLAKNEVWVGGQHLQKGSIIMGRVGKTKAGRILDGQTWEQFPEDIKK